MMADTAGAQAELARKFVSLLLNDSTLHFENGIVHMSQAKELQQEEDAGQWAALSCDCLLTSAQQE